MCLALSLYRSLARLWWWNSYTSVWLVANTQRRQSNTHIHHIRHTTWQHADQQHGCLHRRTATATVYGRLVLRIVHTCTQNAWTLPHAGASHTCNKIPIRRLCAYWQWIRARSAHMHAHIAQHSQSYRTATAHTNTRISHTHSSSMYLSYTYTSARASRLCTVFICRFYPIPGDTNTERWALCISVRIQQCQSVQLKANLSLLLFPFGQWDDRAQ